MAFQKGNPGRPKGSKNKLTRSFRNAVLQAFDQLGGVPAFVRWARDNPTEYYKIAAKLIPKEVDVTMRDVRPVIVDLATPEDIQAAHDRDTPAVH